jgi:hypothetical protein
MASGSIRKIEVGAPSGFSGGNDSQSRAARTHFNNVTEEHISVPCVDALVWPVSKQVENVRNTGRDLVDLMRIP